MIAGRKVVLREKRISDAKDDYAWRSDPELARLDAAPPLRLSFSKFMLTYSEDLQHSSPRQRRFAIETLDGKHIGNCMYYDIDKEKGEAEIGIMLGERSYWDQGYGTDAITTLARHAFEEAGLKRLYLRTLSWNLRAQKCFEKCGFLSCGHILRGSNNFLFMELKRSWFEEKRPEAEA